MTALLWLRRDLRRSDLPALGSAAVAGDGQVAVAYVIDPTLWATARPLKLAWLAANLRAASAAYDGRLILRVGDPGKVIPTLAHEVGAGSVHVSRETTPFGTRRDKAVASAMHEHGVDWIETGTPYALGPGTVRTQEGRGYAVFTPFSRAWSAHGWPSPALEPDHLRLAPARSDEEAMTLVDTAIRGFDPAALPNPGESGARERWEQFRHNSLAAYATDRDRPALDATSGMSPYLKLGVVHPRTLLADLAGDSSEAANKFRAELAWREFYADVLWHNPRSSWHDLRASLSGMVYDDPTEAADLLTAWREGRTGFPIVDAGMRQLAETGWMHNRVRMITASFLTKDLHLPWQVGARHFLEHLIDGDIASNNHGWQWVAGTGTDASPYFRVFNPITQGLTHDPAGDYVRRWVPELRHLPGPKAHEPWKSADGQAQGYPRPIVDHAAERHEALRRYAAARL